MAENSKIEWTTHTFNSWRRSVRQSLRRRPEVKVEAVNSAVTRGAQSHPIPHVKPEIRIGREWPDVMRMQVAPAVVPAQAAAELVAPIHVIAPPHEIARVPQPKPLGRLTVNVARGVWASRCCFPQPLADLGARLQSSGDALFRAWMPFACHTHFCSRLGRVRPALECGSPAFRADPHLDVSARTAPSGPAVEPRSVRAERGAIQPFLALCAPLQALRSKLPIQVNRNPGLLRRNNFRTFRSLSHG